MVKRTKSSPARCSPGFGAQDVSQPHPSRSDWVQVTPATPLGGDTALPSPLLSPSPAAAEIQWIQEEANHTLPVQEQEQRAPGARRAAVCWLSALIHALSLDVHQILCWKSRISHCFQKNTACSRHHNVSLFFCSYSCTYYLQSWLADSKNSNMKLIIVLVNSSAPGQNLHRQSKGFVSSDVAEGSGSIASLWGCTSSPKEKGSTFPQERRKTLAWGQETLGVFFFCAIPLHENICPVPWAGQAEF